MDELIHSVRGLLNIVIKIFYFVLGVTFLVVIPIDMVNDDWEYYKISGECTSLTRQQRPANSNIESIKDHLAWVRSRHNTYAYNRDAALARDLVALKVAKAKLATVVVQTEKACHNTPNSLHINNYNIFTYYWSTYSIGYYFNPKMILLLFAAGVGALGSTLPLTRT